MKLYCEQVQGYVLSTLLKFPLTSECTCAGRLGIFDFIPVLESPPEFFMGKIISLVNK